MYKYHPIALAAQFKNEWLPNQSIIVKLALTITLALVASVSIQGVLISDNLSSLLEEQTENFGGSLTRQVANQLKEPILSRDELTTEHIISSVLSDDNVLGITIYSSNDFLKLARGINPSGKDIERELSDREVSYLWQADDGRRFITFYSPSISNEIEVGRVYVTFSTELLTQAQNTRLAIIIVSTLLVTVIGLLIAYHLSELITRPIYKLIDASKAIASGDYKTQFDKKRGDELGVLSESLNSMTAALIRKGFVEQTLSRYLSDKVAKQVLSEGVTQDLGGKNLEASVLFADIVGFTSISENMDAIAINKMLNDYFSYIDIASQIAHGHVDKYMGDCAMLLFGVPEQDDDHRFHAIYSALLIQNLVEQVNHARLLEKKPIVHFCIGVNSGNMLAGNMGSPSRMEYTVVGDAVNLASRLCSAAIEKEILVASSVIKDNSLKNRICYEEFGEIKVKGKKQAVSVCRVTGVCDALKQRLDMDTSSILSKAK